MYFNRNMRMEKKPEKINSEFPINRINLFTAIPIILLNLGIMFLIMPFIAIVGKISSQLSFAVCTGVIQTITVIWFVSQVKCNKIHVNLIYTKQKRKIPGISLFFFQAADMLFFLPMVTMTVFCPYSISDCRIYDIYLAKGTDLVFIVINTVFFAPVVEEIVFRLIIYNKIKIKYGFKKAIVFSSLIFAVLHLQNSPQNAINALIGGLFFSIVYEYTASLKLSTVMHMVNNAIVIAMINFPQIDIFSWLFMENRSVFFFDTTSLLALSGGIYMTVFFAKYLKKIRQLEKQRILDS